MKPKWILGVAADLAVVAVWGLAVWAAQQSISDSDARRAEAAAETAVTQALQQARQQPEAKPPG